MKLLSNLPTKFFQQQPGLLTKLLIGLFLLVVLILIGMKLGWWVWLGLAVMAAFMWVVFLLLVEGVIIGLLWFLPRYREKRFFQRLHAEGLGKLQENMADAMRILKSAPGLRRRGLSASYALPWYVFIGQGQSGKATLLQSVDRYSHLPETTRSFMPGCDWRFLKSCIIFDVDRSFASHPPGPHPASQWVRFLQLLRHYRELQPINGLILAVGLDTLAPQSSPGHVEEQLEKPKVEAEKLRALMDVTSRELTLSCPVYVLITDCDALEGFTEFCSSFAESTREQVFGYVHPTLSQTRDDASFTTRFRLEPIHTALVERLQTLRSAIFYDDSPAQLSRQEQYYQRIYCFPEEFRLVQKPLSLFVETLFDGHPSQSLYFRGIFFCSTMQQGSAFSTTRQQFGFDPKSQLDHTPSQPYFVHDLFDSVLPHDRELARFTNKTLWWRRTRYLLGFGASIALWFVLFSGLRPVLLQDATITTAVDQSACPAVAQPLSAMASLEAADRCRRVVQELIGENAQRPLWSKLVFNQSVQLQHQLQQHYVQAFVTTVLPPLDAAIARHLLAGLEVIPLVFVLINRIELLNQCLVPAGCPGAFTQALQEDDYRIMLTVMSQGTLTQDRGVSMLKDTYESYLRWSFGLQDMLRREQEAHLQQLRQWLSPEHFKPQQILTWANKKYEKTAILLHKYWDGKTLVPTSGKPIVQVEGAYTPIAWTQSIHPFLQRARDAVPDMEQRLEQFEALYRQQYFEQWRSFLERFRRGEELFQGPNRLLAASLVEETSPYNRILDTAFENLRPFLPAAWMLENALASSAEGKAGWAPLHWIAKVWQPIRQWWKKEGAAVQDKASLAAAESVLPAWVRLLQSYRPSSHRKDYLETLRQLREPFKKDAPTDKSFERVQATFREGVPTEKAVQPVLKAQWIIQQFRKENLGQDDTVFWPLLERPVLIVWRALLEEASEFLKKNWTDSVVNPAQGLSDVERINTLYGAQGKVRKFVNEFMTSFLVENESRFARMLDADLSIHQQTFLKILGDEKQFKQLLDEAGKVPVIITAGKDTKLNGAVGFADEKTDIRLTCKDKPVTLSNKAKDASEASATIYWSPDGCGDVVITILASCNARCIETARKVGVLDKAVDEIAPWPLTKHYAGQSGFLNFMKAFRTTAPAFKKHDFLESLVPAERQQFENAWKDYGMETITIDYRVKVPSGLDKLLTLSSTAIDPRTLFK